MQNTARFDLDEAEIIALKIALRQYLEGFSSQDVREAPAGSNIGYSRALLQRLTDIYHGNVSAGWGKGETQDEHRRSAWHTLNFLNESVLRHA